MKKAVGIKVRMRSTLIKESTTACPAIDERKLSVAKIIFFSSDKAVPTKTKRYFRPSNRKFQNRKFRDEHLLLSFWLFNVHFPVRGFFLHSCSAHTFENMCIFISSSLSAYRDHYIAPHDKQH